MPPAEKVGELIGVPHSTETSDGVSSDNVLVLIHYSYSYPVHRDLYGGRAKISAKAVRQERTNSASMLSNKFNFIQNNSWHFSPPSHEGFSLLNHVLHFAWLAKP